jgi:hypothetical protein
MYLYKMVSTQNGWTSHKSIKYYNMQKLKGSIYISSVSSSACRDVSSPYPPAWKQLASDHDPCEYMYRLSHLFPDVLAFPCSTHWMHLLTNCTTNPKVLLFHLPRKCTTSFLYEATYPVFSFASKDVACSCKLGFTIHLLIWIRSICFNCWMVIRASSMLVLELC